MDKSSEPFGDEKFAVRQKRKLFLHFWALCSIERAALLAFLYSRSIQPSTDDVVAQPEVLDAPTADDDHGVLLELVTFSGNVRSDLHTVSEAHACNLSDGGVWLPWGHRGDLRAHTALERRCVYNRAILDVVESTTHGDGLGFADHLLAAAFYELVDCGHKIIFR